MRDDSTEKQHRSSTRRLFFLGVVLLAALGPAGFLLFRSELAPKAVYTPAGSFIDIHGLAVDPADSRVLYVATHKGLVRGFEDANWMLVGRDRSDLMGFVMHPARDGKPIMYSSGHPEEGGNHGVRISTDGGLSWKVLALQGKTDFHAMAISPLNSQVMYGWDSWTQKLHRSADGGRHWTPLSAQGLPAFVYALAADPEQQNGLWAATDKGLYQSSDGGEQWESVQRVAGTRVTALTFQPGNPKTLYIYASGLGLLLSRDGAASFEELGGGLPKDAAIGYLTIDSRNPSTIYAATYNAALYKSVDGGASWVLLKPSN